MRHLWSRRSFFKKLGLASGLALPFLRPGRAGTMQAQRVIFFYFPDGVVGESQNGEPSLWHCTGSEYDFSLSEILNGLAYYKDRCVFLNGLSMGGTDSGSHPGGAKKLLTAADYGNNESIDQFLSRTAGASSPWHHLYLGAQANYNNATGEKHITYPIAGQSMAPEDDPRRAFSALFGSSSTPVDTGGGGGVSSRATVIQSVKDDLTELRAALGGIEKDKLDYHLESLEELEGRLSGGTPVGDGASCTEPWVDTGAISDTNLYDPETFPAILKAQMDLMVLAMECGMTRVGTIQASMNTSELIMSRFVGTEMYDPSFDMRSHQASHYGASHDSNIREYRDYLAQRKWWVSQYKYLLDALSARPEGDGTMLDNSIVVLCTEVCDGNTHLHDNMPFIVAGAGGGAIRTGRLLSYGGDRHGKLFVSIARAMGQDISSFGDSAFEPLWGFADV